jgi:hypothetical protein
VEIFTAFLLHILPAAMPRFGEPAAPQWSNAHRRCALIAGMGVASTCMPMAHALRLPYCVECSCLSLCLAQKKQIIIENNYV